MFFTLVLCLAWLLSYDALKIKLTHSYIICNRKIYNILLFLLFLSSILLYNNSIYAYVRWHWIWDLERLWLWLRVGLCLLVMKVDKIEWMGSILALLKFLFYNNIIFINIFYITANMIILVSEAWWWKLFLEQNLNFTIIRTTSLLLWLVMHRNIQLFR